MTAFPGSPRLLRGGIVLIDPDSSAIQRIIVLQYNPDSISRTLAAQAIGPESGDRVEALRLKGPPVETIKLDADIDATDQLETPGQNQTAVQLGIYPQLAALETIVYPRSSDIQSNMTLASFGTVEIAPMEAPLSLFVWSQQRIVPVRITEFSITEEMFDPFLRPIRAKVSLGLRVLSVNDLGIGHRGTSLYLAYQQQKEQLATRNTAGTLADLGIRGLP
jgi:hypothetical protein